MMPRRISKDYILYIGLVLVIWTSCQGTVSAIDTDDIRQVPDAGWVCNITTPCGRCPIDERSESYCKVTGFRFISFCYPEDDEEGDGVPSPSHCPEPGAHEAAVAFWAFELVSVVVAVLSGVGVLLRRKMLVARAGTRLRAAIRRTGAGKSNRNVPVKEATSDAETELQPLTQGHARARPRNIPASPRGDRPFATRRKSPRGLSTRSKRRSNEVLRDIEDENARLLSPE